MPSKTALYVTPPFVQIQRPLIIHHLALVKSKFSFLELELGPRPELQYFAAKRNNELRYAIRIIHKRLLELWIFGTDK